MLLYTNIVESDGKSIPNNNGCELFPVKNGNDTGAAQTGGIKAGKKADSTQVSPPKIVKKKSNKLIKKEKIIEKCVECGDIKGIKKEIKNEKNDGKNNSPQNTGILYNNICVYIIHI